MKRLLIAFLATASLVTSCKTADVLEYDNHWRLDSVPGRLNHHFLNGYNPHEDGLYRDYQWGKKQKINKTLARHFLNQNDENPFSYENEDYFRERPVHSIVPHTWDYIHVEGLVMGAILLNPSFGAFLPIPLGSVLGTFEEGGGAEFGEGLTSVTDPLGYLVASFLPGTDPDAEAVRATWVQVK